MTAVLVRGGYVLTASSSEQTPAMIRHGAVHIVDGRIAAVDTYDALRSAHPDIPVHGGPDDIVTPGFVNTHGHFSERGGSLRFLHSKRHKLVIRIREFLHKGSAVQNRQHNIANALL